MKKSLFIKAFPVILFGIISYSVQGQWYSQIRKNIVDTIYADDGRIAFVVKMPGIPPKDHRAPVAEYTRTTKILPLVPAFSWSFGCSATSAAMIAGYYDNLGFPNMYAGPTNNGVMPMNNSSWRDTVIAGETLDQCPLSATCENWDGRTTPGHVDDYWRWYLAPGPDPWTVAGGGSGVQHSYGECTGDYMKTSQWLVPANEINIDGSTTFGSWSLGYPFNADDAENEGVDDTDGMYGFKLFMESRGYTVMSTFTQHTYDPELDTWFDFNDFKWEIDNNRPVLIHVEGHTMVGYGYDDGGGDSIIYIHDTWDYNNHSMRWDHSYEGLTQWGVTVMRLMSTGINVWDGSSGSYWGNAANWSLGHVPTSTETVIIPDLNTPIIIDNADRVCGNLTINPGAILRIMGYNLTVSTDLTVCGEIEFNSNSGTLTVGDDLIWQDGSYLDENTTSDFNPAITVYGDFICNEGSTVFMNHAVVSFNGTLNSLIRLKSPDVQFYHIRNQKTGGASLGLGATSTQSCVVAGNLYMYAGSLLICNSMQSWIIEGFLNNMGGNIHLASGALRFNGNPAGIGLKPNTGDYVNNLFINTGAYTLQLDNSYSSTLTVNGTLTLQSGVLDANAFTIDVNGNWTNSVGPAAFQEETSRVKFSGTGNQYINGDEDFNILETALGGVLYVNNTLHDVTCNSYDWSTGGLYVNAGTLTADDLTDNGLFGNFSVNTEGTLTLVQDAGQFIDLNADMHIYGGNLNVLGGGSNSRWAFAGPASLEMSGGTLNFANYGISVSTNNAFTDNITGGIIRTAGSFSCSRTDFNPTGGTIELTGTNDANLYHAAGSNFFHVNINKYAGSPAGINIRSGSHRKEPPSTRSNAIILSGNLDINGDLTITNGTLDVSASNYSITIAGNWTNNLSSANFNERMGSVIFDGANATDINTNETFFDLTLNKTYPSSTGLELDYGITVNVLGDLYIQDGTLEMNASSSLDINADLTIATGAGINANDPTVTINLAGYWTNNNTGYTTTTGFNPGVNSTVTFDGTSNQYISTTGTEETFYNLSITKPAGSFKSYDNIVVTGDMNLNTGTWEDASSGLMHKFYGDFTVSTGSNFYGSTGNKCSFIGSGDQVITFDPALCGGYLYDVVVDKSVVRNSTRSNLVTLATDIISLNSGNLYVNYGTLDLNGNYYRAVGDVKIGNGGKIAIDNDAWLEVGGSDSLIVYSGGTLEVVGANGHEAKVKGHNDNNYAFVVQSGGNISARYGIFEHMDANGVNVQTGALVNATNDFDYCTFRNGYTGTATLFTIDNNQTLTIDSVNFPTSTTTSNVTKTLDQGLVTFIGASGPFGGPVYENDAFNKIVWAEQGIWKGTVSNDWNTGGNWGWDFVPTTLVDVVLPDGCPFYPVLAGTLGVNSASYTYDCKSLTIDPASKLSFSTSSVLYNYGTVTVNGSLAIGDDYRGYTSSILNMQGDSLKLGTASSDGRMILYSGSTVNQSAGNMLAESFYIYSGSQFNGTAGSTHLYKNGTAPSTAMINILDPDSHFSTFMIDLAANGSMSTSTEDLDCQHFIISGSFDPNGKTVTAAYMDVYGTLTIGAGLIAVTSDGPYFHGPSGTLNMTGGTIDAGETFQWNTGTLGNITGGTFLVGYNWDFKSGISILMGPAHTTVFQEAEESYINCNDDNSTFGSVEFNKPNDPNSDIHINSSEAAPMRVSGDLTISAWNQCILDGDLLIEGECINDAGSVIDMNSGSLLETDGDFTLNGLLDINNGDALIHGVFQEATTGNIIISGGSFLCDHPNEASRAIYYVHGDFSMASGIFEICHNHLGFSNTATENITGGTIRVGGSFLASSGNFTPSGGTVELIDYSGSGSPSIETGGSPLYNLTISGNTTWLIGGAGPSNLYVNNDLTINSGGLNGSDDIIYLGDDWVNNAGNSGFTCGSGRVYLNGTNPTPEVQEIDGTTTFYDLTNININCVIRIDGPVTVNHMYECAAGGPTGQTLVVGSPFNIIGQLEVSQGSFSLSTSAPAVTAGSLVQGGSIQVTDGSLTVLDIMEEGLYGTYTLYNGTIEITQESNSFVDLYADLYIYGGSFNLVGGSDRCYWPREGSHILEMSGGVLDFRNMGIYLRNNNMTYNITGGAIKTGGDFISLAAVNSFDPSAGYVEMYGEWATNVSLGTGSYFHDLVINKTTWPVTATRAFAVKGELKVQQGTFNTNNCLITVGP